MHASRLVYLRILAVALVVASCGGSGAEETTTTAAPPTTAASTTTSESEPVLIVDELEGFEARSVTFANIEFTITGVKVSNQELRSYAEGGEPEIADTYHAFLDITAVNRMSSTMSEGLEPQTYGLDIGGTVVTAADEMDFLSDLASFIRANTGVSSFLAFPVPAGTVLEDALLVIGVPPDRQARLALTGPVAPATYPIEIDLEESAAGVGTTNGGSLEFTVLQISLTEDLPQEHATSPTGHRADEGEIFLVVHALVEHVGDRGGEHLASTTGPWRLLVDGIPRAPWTVSDRPGGSPGGPIVEAGAAVDAWVAFIVPTDADEYVLQVGDPAEDPGLIPLPLPEMQ
jgi:hypothetical protein